MRLLAFFHTQTILVGCFASTTPNPCTAQAPPADRVQVRFDTTEAVAVLAIVRAQREGRSPTAAEWDRLLSSEGYRRLKAREAAMQRAFTDSSFSAFAASDSLGRRASELRRALSAWELADIKGAASRSLAYLPAEARIRATIYIVIKPRGNSFVWDVQTDPAIFLYLDPGLTRQQFASTVAHELHHIGFASIRPRTDSILADLPDSVRAAAEWVGAFSEGFAMLAAAGGPGVHPHTESPRADRDRWDGDMLRFNQDLKALESFFWDVISRRLSSPDAVRAAAAAFYGVQGPWYTVGWKMAVLIEGRFGRSELIRCMNNPRLLLRRYNAAAAEHNRTHADTVARWSPDLLEAFGLSR